MTIDFFYKPGSAPCRSVWLTSKAVGVELNLIETDLHNGDHMKPEYLKVNDYSDWHINLIQFTRRSMTAIIA